MQAIGSVPVFLGTKYVADAVTYDDPGSNKDKLPLMFPHLTEEERIGIWCDYFSMCGDKNEMMADDEFLKFPHVFSFRRDYQSDPLYGMHFKDGAYVPNGAGMLSMSKEDHVYLQCLHSYSGENDQLVLDGVDHGVQWVKDSILNTDRKVVRTDLFQIYWAKDTNVRKFMVDELPKVADYFMEKLQEPLDGKRDRWKIMELAEDVYAWMGKNTSQSKMKYSTKDAVLDFSLVFTDSIDPESFLEAGTGCRRGLNQLFGEVKADPVWQQEAYDKIKAHTRYPLQHNHYSRIEAQVCYAFKFIAHKGRLLPLDDRAKKKHALLPVVPDPLCKTHYPIMVPKNSLEGFFT